jgi:conjugative relaxase-like TrwC/TraI family protein
MPAGSYYGAGREDYYLKKGELPGVWFGRGTDRLGLTGKVSAAAFDKLRGGFGPDGEALVRNAGKKRFAGHDATLSAPKGLSVLWAMHRDPKRRAEIEKAVLDSAKEALAQFESTSLYTRRGKAGAIVERAVGLAAALFLQTTSRSNDPQLHVHCALFNALLCRDGRWRTMLGITARREDTYRQSQSALHKMKMVLGAAFQDGLARRVDALGYRVRRTKDGFDVVGVPQELVERFSTRRKAIEKAMEVRGVTGPRAAAHAAVATRPRKSATRAGDLFVVWRDAAKGFDPNALRGLAPKRSVGPLVPPTRRGTFEEAVARVRARTIGSQAQSTQPVPQRDGAAVRTGSKRSRSPGPDRRTTADDERLLAAAALGARLLAHSRKNGSHAVAPLNVALAVKQVEFLKRVTLTLHDRTSLAAITQKRGAVQMLSTPNAHQTESVLSAARLSWKRAGLKPLFVTSSRAEADRVEKGTGIHSMTVAGLMRGLTTNRGLVRGYLAAQKTALSTGGFERKSSFISYAFKAAGKWIRLDEKTVVVVRVDALTLPEATALMKRAHKAGAKLVFQEEAGTSAPRRTPSASVSELLLRSHLGQRSRTELEQDKRERERAR